MRNRAFLSTVLPLPAVALPDDLWYNGEKTGGYEMLLQELRRYTFPFDECRILNRQKRAGDRLVATAALARRGEEVCLYLLQNDPTYRERLEEAELLDLSDPRPAPATHREELFQRQGVEADLLVESLDAVALGGAAYEISGGETGGVVGQDWESLLLLSALLRAGWDMGGLGDCDTEELFLARYDLRGAFSAIPDAEGPLTLTPGRKTVSGLAAVEVALPLGGCAPIPLDLPDGPAVTLLGAEQFDPWRHLEEVFSHPKTLERFTPEELAEHRERSEKTYEEICPRGMAFPVVSYEAEGDVSIQCYPSSWLDSPLRRSANSTVTFLARGDDALGPHGLPVKRAVLSEAPVPLGDTAPLAIGAVRWHRSLSAEPLILG